MISIIIPVYNVEKYVARCIDSILAQSFQNYEILIVDDCSQDNSMNIVYRYAKSDSRIKIFSHNQNCGLMVARETGYTNATGDYLIFVDSDDFLETDSLATMNEMIQSTDSDIVCFSMTMHDGIKANKTHTYLQEGVFSPKEIFRLLLTDKLIHSMCGKIFRRSLFDGLQPAILHQTNGEDMLLFYQLVAKSQSISINNKSTYYYFSNPNSATHSKFTHQKFDQVVNCLNFRYNFFKNNEDLKELSITKLVSLIEQVLWMNIPQTSLSNIDKSMLYEVNQRTNVFSIRGFLMRIMLASPYLRRLISKFKRA